MLSMLFFFFKQKTAYEMRISDWSSDVCSSDLEFLFLGERMNAERACTMGMVNRVTTRDALATQTRAIAHKLAAQPRMALALTKQSINHVEDLRGKRTAMAAA